MKAAKTLKLRSNSPTFETAAVKRPLSTLMREGTRLMEHAADARETICLRTFLEVRENYGSGRLVARLQCGQPNHPPMLKLASAAMLTMSESLALSETICTGFSSPTINGPITVAPPSS